VASNAGFDRQKSSANSKYWRINLASHQTYSALLSHLKKTNALSQAAGVISWDQETMMPKNGAGARAEQSAALASIIHERNTDPRIADWCAEIDETTLDAMGLANLREAKRSHLRATRIPARLAEEIARQTALGQGVWAKARTDENVAGFLPALNEILKLRREEADVLSEDGGELYDALLDDYEPGMKTAPLAELLGKLRPHLTRLREQISSTSKQISPVNGEFHDAGQMEMARRLASVFNYNWDSGRVDKAVHPFSSGYRSDSRITTRVNLDNVFDCLYSTIHEVGHANYEEGRDPAMDLMPAGGYASMGVHESQSRMLENQIGRSRAFMDWLYPQMVEVFGDIGVSSPDELFAIVNKVESGFIRTEADEVHYNLHVMMRFDLELALIRGDLQVGELEAAWNDRYRKDFGQEVDKPSNGVLQDVHWSCGLFGYFPTYSLGNIFAGEIFATMNKAMPDMEEMISNGNLGEISLWLNNQVHRHGHVYSAPELMEKICGKTPDEMALVNYLNTKFGGFYGF
jgi:carboxypeptidase Taq